jgi:hypothetical protein
MLTNTEIQTLNTEVAAARQADFFKFCPDWAVEALDEWHWDTKHSLRDGWVAHVKRAVREVSRTNSRLCRDADRELSPVGYQGRKTRGRKKVAA